MIAEERNREEVKREVRPLLWAVAEVLRRPDSWVGALEVSEHSVVSNLLWDDGDGRQLRRLSERLRVPVGYEDKLVDVARRWRDSYVKQGLDDQGR